jgi:hypothetical protein
MKVVVINCDQRNKTTEARKWYFATVSFAPPPSV